MKSHSLADTFPLMEGDDFKGLLADIKEHGQREPITLFENQILDGRNRHRACIQLRIKPKFKTLPKSEDPMAFVISENVKRRHLKESQRAWVAAGLINKMQICTFDAARMLNVSERSIKSVLAVLKHGTGKLQCTVEQRYLPVSQGKQAAKLASRDQDRIAADAAACEGRSVRNVIKAKTRIKREKALGKQQRMHQAIWPVKQYGVILADP